MREREEELGHLYRSSDLMFLNGELYFRRIYHLFLRRQAVNFINYAISKRQGECLVYDRWSIVGLASSYVIDAFDTLDNHSRVLLEKFDPTLRVERLRRFLERDKERIIKKLQALIHSADKSHLLKKRLEERIKNHAAQNTNQINAHDDRDDPHEIITQEEKSIIKGFRDEYRIAIKRKLPALDRPKETKMPVSMHWREKKLLEINGYAKSKVKFLHHDVLDHAEAFHVIFIEEHGLTKYKKLLESLGHPFCKCTMIREGELIAAISYGCREYYWLKHNCPDRICQIDLEALFKNPVILKDLPQGKKDLVSHVICNCILESEELQLNHGMTLLFDSEGNLSGRFDPWDREYLEFIYESIVILDKNYDDSALSRNVSLKTEEELWRRINDICANDFSLRILNLKEEKPDAMLTPLEVIEYIDTNIHFIASP